MTEKLSRRAFAEAGAAAGLTFASLAFAEPISAQAPESPIKAGLIGLDTSHVPEILKALNQAKPGGPLDGVKVVAAFPGGTRDNPHSWDRVKKYTDSTREAGVEIVNSIDVLLKKVDVVILTSVNGRPHLEQVKPVIAAGKPVFIDKPLAGTLADAVAIFRLAEKYRAPCYSSSSLRYSADIIALADPAKVGKVLGCEAHSPCRAGGTPPRSLLVRHPRRRDSLYDHGPRLPNGYPHTHARNGRCRGRVEGRTGRQLSRVA